MAATPITGNGPDLAVQRIELEERNEIFMTIRIEITALNRVLHDYPGGGGFGTPTIDQLADWFIAHGTRDPILKAFILSGEKPKP